MPIREFNNLCVKRDKILADSLKSRNSFRKTLNNKKKYTKTALTFLNALNYQICLVIS